MSTARVDSDAAVIAGPAGELEAALDRVHAVEPAFASVVCHPHPLQQGTMQNKVVTTVARAMARVGGVVLRFNYRGVGRSHGQYDGERGELDDALAGVAHLRALPQMQQLPLVIAGFSFGGAIAYRAARETDAAALVTVAPAHQRISADDRGRFANWLLVQGEDDEVIPATDVLQWARGHIPPPKIEPFGATGHFFHGQLPKLADCVSTWLAQALF